jgi:hypothetical protein
MGKAVHRGVTLHVVEREPETLPFVGSLLSRFMNLGFDRASCRTAIEETLRDTTSGASEALLRPEGVTEGGIFAGEALLFPLAEWALRIVRNSATAGRAPWRATGRFDAGSANEVGRLLRLVAGGAEADELRECASWLGERVLRELTLPDPSLGDDFGRVGAPGIYRREHGSVVIRSRTTSLLLDPVCLWMPHAPRVPVEIEGDGAIDAIFVTHGHADHWSIASILAHARTAHVPVIVPAVPRPSILAPNDMLDTLRKFGQCARAPSWGTSLVFGDIHVDVLPFYGEQPTRNGEGPDAQLRNWGNCYRFTTPEFSALALIDSGVDPLGDMADVVRASADTRGPVDFLMSSLPRFHCPFFFGLPHYYLTLPFDRLRSLYEEYTRGELPSVTPGPDGVVEVCAAARARYYVPYGNGFEGSGKPISDVGISIGEPSEVESVKYLRDRFAHHGMMTEPVDWNPGDRIKLENGAAQVTAARELLVSAGI